MQPELSVVIPSVNGERFVLECLEALARQNNREAIEVIVCDRLRDGAAEAIRERFPWVKVESQLYEHSIPALRWHGMKAARADVVAVIEDHCLAPPGWATEVLRTHAQGHDVVAGPVENASRESLFDWAFFLLEYGSSMPPLASGEAAAALAPGERAAVPSLGEGDPIPGVNISYKKAVLPLEDKRFAELWESFLIDELRRQGARIHVDPGMLIHHRTPFSFREFAVQKYLYSRSFAAMRVSGKGLAVRLAYAGFAVTILPLMLLMRLIRTVWAKKSNRSELLLALPMIAVLVCCGSTGEAIGYCAGDGGSLRAVR
jgi:glycosyltransferase involved in cell wall biosynthesis